MPTRSTLSTIVNCLYFIDINERESVAMPVTVKFIFYSFSSINRPTCKLQGSGSAGEGSAKRCKFYHLKSVKYLYWCKIYEQMPNHFCDFFGVNSGLFEEAWGGRWLLREFYG